MTFRRDILSSASHATLDIIGAGRAPRTRDETQRVIEARQRARDYLAKRGKAGVFLGNPSADHATDEHIQTSDEPDSHVSGSSPDHIGYALGN